MTLNGCQELRLSMIGAFVFHYYGLLANPEFKRGKRRCGDEPAELLSYLQVEKHTKDMFIDVEGYAPFKGQFTWFKAPSLCGDVPISVWLSSQWFFEYTIGQDAQRRVHRLAEKLQYDLKELEFSPLHCMESLLSRHRKRQKRNAEDATDDLEGCQEWRVSMIGAFVFLFMACWTISAERTAAAKSQMWVPRAIR